MHCHLVGCGMASRTQSATQFDYAKFRSRSCRAVIRVFDEAGNVIENHEHKGDFKLVAAELSKHGFIASPTSRSARAADVLATDAECKRAFSIQVKTKTTQASYWLLSSDYKRLVSRSHVYVFVNVRKGPLLPEFFVVPSSVVAR